MARDVYIAIMVAAAKGKGLHLSADEVADLAMDDAISTYAANGLTEDEHRAAVDSFDQSWQGWASIDPRKARKPWHGNCRDIRGRLDA